MINKGDICPFYMNSRSSKISLPSHKTKIVCTIGPASRTKQTLQKMITQGMTIARMNFSHGTLEEHLEDIITLRQLAHEHHQLIPIMIDLPGAKIRIGQLHEEPIRLETGATTTLTTSPVTGTAALIPVHFPDLPQSVSPGNIIYLNDGLIELRVTDISGDNVACEVITGGPLLSKKGVNLPGGRVRVDPISQYDLDIVQFGIEQGITIFSVSFVEKKQDIQKVKDYAKNLGRDIFVIAKIERDEAIQHFDEILDAADGIMIARGDLGMEIPIEDVPNIQKQLIKKANQQGKPVITATQMLKSMTETSRPTRAEVADVANAILDGTDAIMLSEETAIGKYPIESVQMMAKIARSTEAQRCNKQLSTDLRDHAHYHQQTPMTVSEVISFTVNEAQQLLHPKFILVTTASGSTARRISRFKPDSWILAFSRHLETCGFLLFSYGVYPFHMENPEKSWHHLILDFLKKQHLVQHHDIVLLTQRRFAKEKGGTDSLGVIVITDE